MKTTIRSPRHDRLSCLGSRRLRQGRVVLVALLWSLALASQAAVTDGFTAKFDVHRGKLGLGTTEFSLANDTSPNCYIYRGRADPNALVRLFLGDVRDESRFCVEDDALRPSHYSHRIQGDDKKSYTLDFDWAAGQVHYANKQGTRQTLPLAGDELDPLSIQIAARRWVAEAPDPDTLAETAFRLVDEDEIKTYRLRATDGGTISTPGGRYDTLRVDRVDDNKRLSFWLARNADWIPVRVEQQKGDGAIIQMNLTSLER
ncbi:DUF3108 domain-containing protein [Salinisphaera sp. T31B1]|uniref:DUF3108 domain-containing protein n=1 Tax=Salinisphaera sp. T31B1 TaxID=727963 RepID=UPI00333FD3BF